MSLFPCRNIIIFERDKYLFGNNIMVSILNKVNTLLCFFFNLRPILIRPILPEEWKCILVQFYSLSLSFWSAIFDKICYRYVIVDNWYIFLTFSSKMKYKSNGI